MGHKESNQTKKKKFLLSKVLFNFTNVCIIFIFQIAGTKLGSDWELKKSYDLSLQNIDSERIEILTIVNIHTSDVVFVRRI